MPRRMCTGRSSRTVNSARTMPCVLVLPPRSKYPGFHSLRIWARNVSMMSSRWASSSCWIFSSASLRPSSLRFRLMSAVNSVDSRSRRSLSKTGRKKGSTRRSTWIRNKPASAIQFNRRLPVSAGGNPKPGPGPEGRAIPYSSSAASERGAPPIVDFTSLPAYSAERDAVKGRPCDTESVGRHQREHAGHRHQGPERGDDDDRRERGAPERRAERRAARRERERRHDAGRDDHQPVTKLRADDRATDDGPLRTVREVDERQQEHERRAERDRGDRIDRRPGDDERERVRDQRERGAARHERHREDHHAREPHHERGQSEPGDGDRWQDGQRERGESHDEDRRRHAQHQAYARRSRGRRRRARTASRGSAPSHSTMVNPWRRYSSIWARRSSVQSRAATSATGPGARVARAAMTGETAMMRRTKPRAARQGAGRTQRDA